MFVRTTAFTLVLLAVSTPLMAEVSLNLERAQKRLSVMGEYQVAQRTQETLPCSPNCDSALSGNERIMDKNLDGSITRDEFRGPKSLFGKIDTDNDGKITEKEVSAYKSKRGSGSATTPGKTANVRFLDEAEIRQAVTGNTLRFNAPSNGKSMSVYFAEDGKAIIKTAGKAEAATRRWFINEKGMLCRTFGKANKNHCTRVQTTEDPNTLTMLNPNLRYEATLQKGKIN
jgi:hypothetical protein